MSEEENKENLTIDSLVYKNQQLEKQVIELKVQLQLMKQLYNELLDRRF